MTLLGMAFIIVLNAYPDKGQSVQSICESVVEVPFEEQTDVKDREEFAEVQKSCDYILWGGSCRATRAK